MPSSPASRWTHRSAPRWRPTWPTWRSTRRCWRTREFVAWSSAATNASRHDHYHDWDMLRANLLQLLVDGTVRPHEPAYDLSPMRT